MMKETEMHNGLPDREMRIFIANDIRVLQEMDSANVRKSATPDKDNMMNYFIQDCRNTIEFYEQKLKILELRKGLQTVIAMHNWEEFDVSDENIRAQPGQTFCLSFIGTKAEYQALLEKLENPIYNQ